MIAITYDDLEELASDCAGCTYWDGDDGRCRNGGSRMFMMVTEDGCEKREGYDAGAGGL